MEVAEGGGRDGEGVRDGRGGILMNSMNWFARLFGEKRAQRKADLERELQDHLDLEAEQHRQAGRPADEAQYAAQRALGNPLQVAEAAQEVWGWTWLARLHHAPRFRFPILPRHPALSPLPLPFPTL